MRLAVVSDLHITERPCRSDVGLDAQAKILSDIAADIEKGNIDAIVIPGDIYDGQSTSHERDVAWRWLDRVRMTAPVFIIRGNHDDELDIEAMFHLDGVSIATMPQMVIWVDGLKIALAPWPFRKVENGAALYADVVRGLLAQKPDVLVAHCDLVGAKLDGGQETTGKVNAVLTPDDFTVPTFLGHYHKRQHLGANAWYGGAIRQMHFGDDAAKGFGIYDTDAKSWEWFGPYGRKLLTVDGFEFSEAMKEHCEDWDHSSTQLRGLPNVMDAAPGDLVRIKYPVREDRREEVRASVEEFAKEKLNGAGYVIEPTVIADTRTRGAEVASAVTPREKLDAYWGDNRPARADQIIEKMEAINGNR